MNTNQHKYLIWVSTIVVALLGIFLISATAKLNGTATITNTVSFSGEGKVLSKPDIGVVSFSIVTEAQTSKAAQDDNSKKSQKVTEFLKDQGIEDKDVKTTGYNVYPQYNNYPRPCPLGMPDSSMYPCGGNEQKISGYQISQSFQAKVRNLDKVSAVLDGVVGAGANQVYGLSFEVDDAEALKEKAREMAIKDAKDKADTLRKQLGIKLGRIINFSENGSGWPMPMYYEAKALDIGRGGATPSVPTGENEIVVNVTLTYQIK